MSAKFWNRLSYECELWQKGLTLALPDLTVAAVAIANARQSLEPVAATAYEAKLLGIKVGAALMLERKAFQILLLCTTFWALSFPAMKTLALTQQKILPGSGSWFFSSCARPR